MRIGLIVAPLFVVLWSTGFLGAKLGLPHAEPMTFLAVRFALVAMLLALWVFASGARWLGRGQIGYQILIGMLVHYIYLGGVFAAISMGVEAGVSAMIVGLQPAVTALAAWRILGERLLRIQWLGMILGFGGVVLVVMRKLDAGIGEPAGIALCCFSLIGIAFGSILQKSRGEDTPMRSGNVIQFAAASVCCGLTALAFEHMEVDWHPEFLFALGWLIVVLSLGAITLLYILIRRGAASSVASLFFLVPPCTALLAWPLFGETLGPVEIAGMAMTALGVLIVNRPGLFGVVAR